MGNPARKLTEPLPDVIPDIFLINGFTFEFSTRVPQAERRSRIQEALADPKSYEPYIEDDEYDRFCDPGTGLFSVIQKAA